MGSVASRPSSSSPILAGMLAATVSAAAAASIGRDAVPPAAADLITFLKTDVGFSADDIQWLDRGDVVVNGLRADDETVAIAAAMHVDVPPRFFLERFRRIAEFKKTPEVQQIWRLGVPPSPADIAGLTLDSGELKNARQCAVGNCDFKLDAAGIERLRSARDDDAALHTLRAHLADYAAAYLKRGNAALMEYRDRSRPLAMDDQIERILAASPYLLRDWPDLHEAIGEFSGTLPRGLEDFVYWSKEKVASRPVVSLTHVIIRPERDGISAIATKQLYASHYTTASLGMTFLADRGGPKAPRTLVVYVNRTRVDVFGGLLGGLKRPVVRSRARSGAERMMRALRMKLEAEFNRRSSISELSAVPRTA
jgi:hypothetical protein